jgi:IclR family pca regulon transcriptional regulator
MDNSRNFIASLARGLAVLGAFTKEKKFLTLTEISNLTGINKTAIQRLTYTLHQLGYLERDESKLFRLGPSTLSIGLAVLRNLEIRELAYPYLKDLSKKFGQTVNLSILDETEIVVIERFEVRKIIDYHLQIGSRLPAHCTSAGKAILAFLSKKKREITLNKMSFEKLTEYTITDKVKLLKDLEVVKDKGFALNSQELALGSRTTGAPIFSRDGQVIAAVSISANASLFTLSEVERDLSPYIVKLANKISAMLGYDSSQVNNLMNFS